MVFKVVRLTLQSKTKRQQRFESRKAAAFDKLPQRYQPVGHSRAAAAATGHPL